MSIEDVLEALEFVYGIEGKEDGFISLPKAHTFAVWRISGRIAEGSDGYALYWNVTYELSIFYRDSKKDDDKSKEKRFEHKLRYADNLTSDYGYDSKDNLYITTYRFNTTVDF